MKKISMTSDRFFYLLIAAVMCCILLSSHGRSISIDRRGIVHAIGIDLTAKGYRVSLQIFQPAGMGSDTAVDVTGANIAVAVSEGKTISEAIAAAGSKTGKELFFGHLQLICLGNGLNTEGHDELFAFATGSTHISPSTELCMSEGKAEKLMELKLTEEETSAEALYSLLKTSAEYSRTIRCDLKGFLSDEGCAVMPVLAVADTDSGDEQPSLSKAVRLAGTAVFSKGEMTVINEDKALCAALLSGKAEKGTIVTELDGIDITSELDSCKRRRNISIENGRLILRTYITVSARPDRELDPEQSRRLSTAAAHELERNCFGLQEEMFSRGDDIFGTVQLIRQRFPGIRLRYDVRELTAAVDIYVNVSVKVV